MKKMICALTLGMASFVSQSETIDVAFVVDSDVVATQSREWVDDHIESAITLSNQTLNQASLDYKREVKMVFTEASGNSVAIATQGIGGALDGVTEACEVVKAVKYNNFDNVVWIVPTTGNVFRTGNQMYCADTDHQVAVVAINAVTNLGHVIAHELGHADNMGHAAADSHYEATGEVTLMSSYLSDGMGETLLVAQDIADMQAANLTPEIWPKFYSYPRPSAADVIGTIVMEPSSVSINGQHQRVSFAFSLNEPLAEDVSVEFFTNGVTAKQGEDYEENISRVALLAGQTEATADVMYLNVARTGAETMEVGVRYGDKVAANDSLSVSLPVTASSDSGGGGAVSLLLGLMLTVCVWRRRE